MLSRERCIETVLDALHFRVQPVDSGLSAVIGEAEKVTEILFALREDQACDVEFGMCKHRRVAECVCLRIIEVD